MVSPFPWGRSKRYRKYEGMYKKKVVTVVIFSLTPERLQRKPSSLKKIEQKVVQDRSTLYCIRLFVPWCYNRVYCPVNLTPVYITLVLLHFYWSVEPKCNRSKDEVIFFSFTFGLFCAYIILHLLFVVRTHKNILVKIVQL